MAALENRQKPSGRERSAWWAGGRTAAKALRAQPSMTASTACTDAPAARRAASALPALMTVSLSSGTCSPGSGRMPRMARHIIRRMDAGQLFLGGGRGGCAQQGEELLRLQGAQHGAQAVGAFRVPGAGVVLEARGVGDQGNRHGRLLGFSPLFCGSRS